MEKSTILTKRTSKHAAVNLLALAAIAAFAVPAADAAANASVVPATDFTQRIVVSGGGGDPVCNQGSQWSTEDYVCTPAEIAPSAAQRSIEVTASGHAVASVVVTNDGFGTGRPVLSIKNGVCPANVRIEDGTLEQVGAKAEFVITPVHGGSPRTVSAILAQPQPAQFLREGRSRQVFALPTLEQPLATAEPVDLGAVQAGDHIKLRLLAIGTMTSCENGALKSQPVQAGLWGPSSIEKVGYLTATRTTTWDNTKVAPFKAVATISY